MRRALERQTRQPDEIVAVPDRSAGVPTDAVDWVWLLDRAAVPHDSALEAFAGALARCEGLGSPALLAGKVVSPDGSLDARSLPFPEVRDPDLVAAAFERRVAPVRLVRAGSLFVQARALKTVAHPAANPLGWSARLLADRLGLLVPTSVATRPRQDGRPSTEARVWLRLLAGDALEPRDRAYLALRLAEGASGRLRELAGRARGAP